MSSPESIIDLIRRTFGRYASESGGCLKFHILLLRIFPEASGWYNSDHVLTEIDGVMYDIDGIYAKDTKSFLPIGVAYWTPGMVLKQFECFLTHEDQQFFLKHYRDR